MELLPSNTKRRCELGAEIYNRQKYANHDWPHDKWRYRLAIGKCAFSSHTYEQSGTLM